MSSLGTLTAVAFIYVWVYRVVPGNVDEFIELYGPDGAWVRLFRQAPGYLDTSLYRDRNDVYRYLTVDRWESEEAFREFRMNFATEFDRLDNDGERLTLEEKHLGDFVPVLSNPRSP